MRFERLAIAATSAALLCSALAGCSTVASGTVAITPKGHNEYVMWSTDRGVTCASNTYQFMEERAARDCRKRGRKLLVLSCNSEKSCSVGKAEFRYVCVKPNAGQRIL